MPPEFNSPRPAIVTCPRFNHMASVQRSKTLGVAKFRRYFSNFLIYGIVRSSYPGYDDDEGIAMQQEDGLDVVWGGSGQATRPVAPTITAAGKRAAAVASRHDGGTRVDNGCTPAKTLVASAHDIQQEHD